MGVFHYLSRSSFGKYFVPDLSAGLLLENQGRGFTRAFLFGQMGWIIAAGIFLREGIE